MYVDCQKHSMNKLDLVKTWKMFIVFATSKKQKNKPPIFCTNLEIIWHQYAYYVVYTIRMSA